MIVLRRVHQQAAPPEGERKPMSTLRFGTNGEITFGTEQQIRKAESVASSGEPLTNIQGRRHAGAPRATRFSTAQPNCIVRRCRRHSLAARSAVCRRASRGRGGRSHGRRRPTRTHSDLACGA